MKKTSHNNFSLGFKDKLTKDKVHRLYVMHKFGSGKLTKKSTSIKLRGQDWDKSKKHLVKKLQKDENYSSECLWIDEFYTTIKGIGISMDKGEMTLDTAFNLIFNRNKEGLISKFLNSHPKLDNGGQRNKYLSFLRSVEKHLPNELKPLTFTSTQDSVIVNRIASILKDTSLKPQTIGDYMKMLDYVTREANLKTQSPFKSNGLIPSKGSSNKRPRTYIDLIQGLNKIKTKKDYLAVNFWLYSLCLRGLNGSDICCLSEDWIGNGNYSDAYYPDHQIDPIKYEGLKDKTHLSRERGKSLGNGDMTILLNLFPTFILHQSLKQLIKEEYPHYAYKGTDKLRLFNFTTKDKKYKVDEDGKKKWTKIKDTISPKTSNIIGEGINNARHTFVTSAESLGNVSDDEQRKMLGHKAKGALSHYQSLSQIKIDLHHIQTLDEIRILSILDLFYEVGIEKGFITQYLTPFTRHLLKDDSLMIFPAEDELKLMKLTAEYEEKPEFKLIDGKIQQVASPKPERLLNLEREKASLMKKREEDNSWVAQATQKITGFISQEDAENYTDAWTTLKSLELMETNSHLI